MRPVRWWLFLVWGLWTMFVWSNRIMNIWADLVPSTEEKVADSAVAVSFVVLGLVMVVLSFGMRRYPPTRADHIVVGVLAGWSVGIWILRAFDIIAGGDHDLPFVVVHTALAAVSIALAGLAWFEVSRIPLPPRASPDDGPATIDGLPASDAPLAVGGPAAVDDLATPPAGSVAGTSPQ